MSTSASGTFAQKAVEESGMSTKKPAKKGTPRPAPRHRAPSTGKPMCPTCEGREPAKGEEAYIACVLCLTTDDVQQARLPLAS